MNENGAGHLMTVAQHNEQLILEKHQLLNQIEQERNTFGLILAGVMRQMRRKTIKLKPEMMVQPGVNLDFKDNGEIVITFIQPKEALNGQD